MKKLSFVYREATLNHDIDDQDGFYVGNVLDEEVARFICDKWNEQSLEDIMEMYAPKGDQPSQS